MESRFFKKISLCVPQNSRRFKNDKGKYKMTESSFFRWTFSLTVQAGSRAGMHAMQRILDWAEAGLKWVFVGFPTLVITHREALVRGNDPHPDGCGGSWAAWGSEAGKQRPVGVKPRGPCANQLGYCSTLYLIHPSSVGEKPVRHAGLMLHSPSVSTSYSTCLWSSGDA